MDREIGTTAFFTRKKYFFRSLEKKNTPQETNVKRSKTFYFPFFGILSLPILCFFSTFFKIARKFNSMTVLRKKTVLSIKVA